MGTLTRQEHYYGCGFACIASLLGLSYREALRLIPHGYAKASSSGLLCKEISQILQSTGHKDSTYKYLKPRLMESITQPGTIVFIKRSKQYPVGHYLLRGDGYWMDPWINMRQEYDPSKAEAGFRDELPGDPIYAIFSK
jgi:hypothetical protein